MEYKAGNFVMQNRSTNMIMYLVCECEDPIGDAPVQHLQHLIDVQVIRGQDQLHQAIGALVHDEIVVELPQLLLRRLLVLRLPIQIRAVRAEIDDLDKLRVVDVRDLHHHVARHDLILEESLDSLELHRNVFIDLENLVIGGLREIFFSPSLRYRRRLFFRGAGAGTGLRFSLPRSTFRFLITIVGFGGSGKRIELGGIGSSRSRGIL
ncbi:hypothetical protein C1H46_005645 [Malus baccata]|uniref:Uncharacterized protein n=1 Tax=Malus baccata TaxID=106549 RepID=A0A540NCM9_MALBA|nr:hypothetical protein C1H46_005645 [Malus baccata]